MTARVAGALLVLVAAAVVGLVVLIGREPTATPLSAPAASASAAPTRAERGPELVTLPPDAAPRPPSPEPRETAPPPVTRPPKPVTLPSDAAPPPAGEAPRRDPGSRAEIWKILGEVRRARPDEKPPLIEKLGKLWDPLVLDFLRSYVMGFEVPGDPAMTRLVRLAAAKALGRMRDPNNPALAARAAQILMDACEERFNKKERDGDAVVRMCLESFGKLQEKAAFGFLKSKVTSSNNYWAADAIGALEKYQEPALVLQTIDPIVNEWLRADDFGVNRWANDAAKERRTVVGEAAGRTLALVTGQNFDSPQKWRQWWAEAQSRGWTPPKPAEEGK
ncbi:MAG: hypothetical protein L0216_18790 [Planctomycetales bacterium]|nr:hypothetical protein [Planctomycetales bacterium]